MDGPNFILLEILHSQKFAGKWPPCAWMGIECAGQPESARFDGASLASAHSTSATPCFRTGSPAFAGQAEQPDSVLWV